MPVNAYLFKCSLLLAYLFKHTQFFFLLSCFICLCVAGSCSFEGIEIDMIASRYSTNVLHNCTCVWGISVAPTQNANVNSCIMPFCPCETLHTLVFHIDIIKNNVHVEFYACKCDRLHSNSFSFTCLCVCVSFNFISSDWMSLNVFFLRILWAWMILRIPFWLHDENVLI